jgi:hypothetical protein
LQNVRVDSQYVGIIEEQTQQIKQLQEELAELNHANIEHCQQMQAGGRMFEDIKEGEYDCNRPHKSASNCFLCKRSHLARKQDASKELE